VKAIGQGPLALANRASAITDFCNCW